MGSKPAFQPDSANAGPSAVSGEAVGVDDTGRSGMAIGATARTGIATAAGTADPVRGAESGLTTAQAQALLREHGPNLVHTYTVRWYHVLLRQVRSPLLMLLAATTVLAFALGQHTDALIITVIMSISVALGFSNEYRAERTAIDLHARIQHTCQVLRDGAWAVLPVADVVPGDVVMLTLGTVVPAEVRIIASAGLECNESVLTGESLPAPKSAGDAAFMGTVVAAGSGRGVVTATGADTVFGKVSLELGLPQPLTGFQVGLQKFSGLLLVMASFLVLAVIGLNLWRHHSWLETLLVALAICVGITPQMLPAVVSISLARGARDLAAAQVLVKRLISIEDLGDIEVLFTDKTGTLTIGELQFLRALDPAGGHSDALLLPALLACAADGAGHSWQAGANPLDSALWRSAAVADLTTELPGYAQIAALPFDHERQRSSRLVTRKGTAQLLVKGAAESVLPLCGDVPGASGAVLQAEYERGSRVIALAARPWTGELRDITAEDERDLILMGFLVFEDAPKESAREALRQLAALGIDIKVLTGDHPVVAQRVCEELGIGSAAAITGTDIDALSDEQLREVVTKTTVFARLSPEHKVRIVRAQRALGSDVGFLGDGVNDAPALHEADVGISVSNATDVAQDAADVILLRKDLAVLATGVMQGRRVFTNTIKYVLMAASSNFGNMFSAAGASVVLPFLPMLPSQVLLNNLLYDCSQLAICTDNVDAEQLRRPSHWDMALIQRYMWFFGLISSAFDFGTFAVMLNLFHAVPEQFRAGWFAESLATQTLVVLVIRTRRSPFWRSKPSTTLLWPVLVIVAIGVLLPMTMLGPLIGFRALSGWQLLTLSALVLMYLAMVEVGKRYLAGRLPHPRTAQRGKPFKTRRPHRHLRRRLRRFTTRVSQAR